MLKYGAITLKSTDCKSGHFHLNLTAVGHGVRGDSKGDRNNTSTGVRGHCEKMKEEEEKEAEEREE